MTGAAPDPVTHALTGVWPLIMLVSALLTFPVSALLLWFYRRAVLRRMSESRKGEMPATETIAETDAPPKPLRFVSLGANASPTTTLAGPWAAAVVYLAAGAAYALIMTAAWFLATHGQGWGGAQPNLPRKRGRSRLCAFVRCGWSSAARSR